MSADRGPTEGTPPIGDALVAALGFEPTDSDADEVAAGAKSVDTAVAPPVSETNGSSAGDGVMGVGSDEALARKTVAAPTPESVQSQANVNRPVSEKGASVGRHSNTGKGAGSTSGSATSSQSGVAKGNGSGPSGSSSLAAEVATPADGVNRADNTGPIVVDVAAQESDVADLTDSHSSGVKPIVPAPPDIVAQPPPPTVVPELVGEANALLAGDTAVGERHTQPVVVPDGPPMIGDPVAPVSPPLVGSVTKSPRGKIPDNVVGKVGDLAARVPKLLEERPFQRTRRVRARKVRRVVRHIDPWSVLTFSVLFHLCVFAALLLSSVLVWNAAVAAGTIENIESFVRELGDYQTYEINGDVVFRAAMVITGILTLASSVLLVLLTVVFNLISDLVGGIRFTVVEEETVRVRRQRNQ